MKKIITLAILVIAMSSCATTYYGNVKYYLPDGSTETYKAYIQDFHDGKEKTVYCDWGNGTYMITSGIPYKFIGNNNGYSDVTGEEYVTYNYNGKEYKVQKEIWDSVQTLAKENGRLDTKRAKELIEDYIVKNIINKPKFNDGVYND